MWKIGRISVRPGVLIAAILAVAIAAALFMKPEERGAAEAMELNDVISMAGLGDVCQEWVGELPES